MPVILAVDTSSTACSAALLTQNSVHERFELTPKAHTRLVLPMVESVLAEAGMTLGDVDAIAFGRGPGSFTGVRIATSLVQGLAFGADLPVVPVSTLAAMALQAAHAQVPAHTSADILCAIDARMNEVYWAGFHYNDGNLIAVGDECVCAPSRLPAWQGDIAAYRVGAGSGWQYQSQFPAEVQLNLAQVVVDLEPRAREIALLGAQLYESGQQVLATEALPVYLRDEVTWKKLPGR